MTGRAMVSLSNRARESWNARPRLRGLAKQDLPQVVLQEERVGHAQAGEEPDDIAVEENRLASARGRIGAVLQVHLVRDDVLRVARVARLRGAEEAEQRAFGAQDARELIGERLCGGLVHIVDQVPAEDAVDGGLLLRKPRLQEGRQRVELAVADMSIEVGEDVLDENLAPELLAE